MDVIRGAVFCKRSAAGWPMVAVCQNKSLVVEVPLFHVRGPRLTLVHPVFVSRSAEDMDRGVCNLESISIGVQSSQIGPIGKCPSRSSINRQTFS